VRRYWDTEDWERETEELKQRFPELEVQRDLDSDSLVLVGKLPVMPDVAYSVTIELNSAYPRSIPQVRCDPEEVEPIPARHVNAVSGEACLCVRSELRIHWPRGSSISEFIKQMLLPYLDAQFYYDTHSYWPPGRERSHGREGILEAYGEFAKDFGDTSVTTIERLLRLLARKQDPKGHEVCPCCSGRPIRKCHRDALKKLRETVEPEFAAADLADCFPAAAKLHLVR
jgi:hypothetical protein